MTKKTTKNGVSNSRERGEVKSAAYNVAYESKNNNNTNFYVINSSTGGFVIVSGEESTEKQILGYSDKGSFDYNKAPDGLKTLFSDYDREINIIRNNYSNTSSGNHNSSYSVENSSIIVDALISTKWGQSTPYNGLCDGNLTGCVATAMAQVMNYWKYPAEPTPILKVDKYKYYYNYYCDEYLWRDIEDSYPSGYLYNNKNESLKTLANIMHDAGASVDMEYGKNLSGIDCLDVVAESFVKYFKYSSSAMFIDLDTYNINDWTRILKNELDNHRPVIYGVLHGVQSGLGIGGHCFICDGYTENDLFHFNFGWDGLDDGWYAINTKSFDTCNYGSFHLTGGKSAVVGIEPPQE